MVRYHAGKVFESKDSFVFVCLEVFAVDQDDVQIKTSIP